MPALGQPGLGGCQQRRIINGGSMTAVRPCGGRIAARISTAALAALTIAAGVMAAPSAVFAADPALTGRPEAVTLLLEGGPVTSRAAEAALLGSPEQMRQFMAGGRAEAALQ